MGGDVHNPNDIRQLYDSYQSKVRQKMSFILAIKKLMYVLTVTHAQLKQFRGLEEKALQLLWLLLAFNVVCT